MKKKYRLTLLSFPERMTKVDIIAQGKRERKFMMKELFPQLEVNEILTITRKK